MTRICFQAIALASAPAPRSWAPLWGRSLLQVTVRGGEGPAGTPTRDFLLAPGFRDPERSARGSAGQCGAETRRKRGGNAGGSGEPGHRQQLGCRRIHVRGRAPARAANQSPPHRTLPPPASRGLRAPGLHRSGGLVLPPGAQRSGAWQDLPVLGPRQTLPHVARGPRL